MKKTILVIFLLITAFSFGQAEKDSLFAKDVGDIYNTLRVMYHLERSVMEYYIMPEKERIATGKTFQYYFKKNIIATNPVPSIDILRYLEIYLQKDIPDDWKSFMKKVNNANAKMLLALTDKYGYPSKKRLDKFTGIDTDIQSINFAIRPNLYTEVLGKMLRKENRKGNVSDRELELFIFIGGREAVSGKEIMKSKNKHKMRISIPE